MKIGIFILFILTSLSPVATALDYVIPLRFYEGAQEFEAVVMLPKWLRREFGSMDAMDLILSEMTDEQFRQNRIYARAILQDYRAWLKSLYQREDLVDADKEIEMVQRMLGEDEEEDSSLILLFSNGQFIGSLRGVYSTNVNPIPRPIKKLDRPQVNARLTRSAPVFRQQVIPLVRPYKGDENLAEIVWEKRNRWWDHGVSYLANFTVKPITKDSPTLRMLYTLAIVTKVWERGGESVPRATPWPGGDYRSFFDTITTYLRTYSRLATLHGAGPQPLRFHWPRGMPRVLRRESLGMLNDLFVLTCDGEDPTYERLYLGYGFEVIDRYYDEARGGKQTLAMLGTKDSFVSAFERKASRGAWSERLQPFRLNVITHWDGVASRSRSEVSCAGHFFPLPENIGPGVQITRPRSGAKRPPR